ncbi:acyl-CoA dehydrogenase family protein [Actinoplanes philippinensis]|uniref:acyl-CoA dehydrogenase family protein n=1 Tax=Actinoplanes philippinensis TaxID=35752 RepID=UPI0033CD0463
MDDTTVAKLGEAAALAADDARFAVEALQILKSDGALGLGIPEEYGGRGETVRAQLGAIFDAGRSSASVGTILSMHLQQVHALVRYGSPQLKETVLPEIATGRVYLGSVTTEKASGGDLRASSSPLARRGDEVHVVREAPIVTGAEEADAFLIKMADGEQGASSLVYVPRSSATVTMRPNTWDPLGMRESGSAGIHIEATVPSTHVIGAPCGFETIVKEVFGPFAHLGWAASWLGSAAEAGDRLVDAMRHDNGLRRKVMDSDLSLSRLARARECLDTVHALLELACQDFESDRSVGFVPALRNNGLKTAASRHCFEAADLMVELGGLAHGYMRSSPTGIEKAFRDLRSASLNYSNDRLYRDNGRFVLRAGFGGIGAW